MKKLILIVFCLLCSTAYADIPKLIDCQGKLTDSDGNPLQGNRHVTFRIFDDLNAGQLLWEETQTITMDNGIFDTMLGATVN